MKIVNRREFLQKGSLGIAALTAACQRAEEQPEPAAQGKPLSFSMGVQLYTVRNELEKDLEGTIAKVAAIGYKEVEMYSLHGKPASEVAQILTLSGLKSPSGHYMLDTLRSGWEKQIEDAKTLGMEYMVCPILPEEERNSLDNYRKLADLFNQRGEDCRKAGMRFCYHNHNFEFQSFDGVLAYDELLQRTDPELVQMELDCFWITYAGHDPLEYFDRHPGRFALLHIKDLKADVETSLESPEGFNPFTEVGRGRIDWTRILGAAEKAGVKHIFVEQDETDGSPLESLQVSYNYLSELKI